MKIYNKETRRGNGTAYAAYSLFLSLSYSVEPSRTIKNSAFYIKVRITKLTIVAASRKEVTTYIKV